MTVDRRAGLNFESKVLLPFPTARDLNLIRPEWFVDLTSCLRAWDSKQDKKLPSFRRRTPWDSDLPHVFFLSYGLHYRMWHELRVVLHNRENALLSQAVQAFSREERDFSEGVANNWSHLAETIQDMPYE